MMSLRRPKPGEDDLEEMMKEFEAQKLAPSASVVNVNKRPTEENKAAGNLKDGKQKSLFSQKRLKTKDDQMKKKFHLPDTEEPTTSEFNVLNEIVEKNVSGPLEVMQPSMPGGNAVGKHFPDVMKLVEIDPKTDLKDKKKSLFAKQFKQMKKDIHSNVSNERDGKAKGNKINSSSFGSSSRILSGSGLERSDDLARLHEENLQTLNQMTEEEILEQQEKLFNSMDKDLVNFLKNKKKTATPVAEMAPAGEQREPEEPESSDKLTDLPVNEDLTLSMSDYPGMQRVEKDKLEWQGELPPLKAGQLAGLSARFGFDGRLLAADSEVAVSAGLHHHGEEQERPGYTLEEMMILCRSSNNRQRQVGLELVEAVLERWWTGELDLCLEQNLVQEVVGAGLVQVIRLSLDSSEAGLVVAGVRALVALLCCREEERLLDWVVELRQPVLAPTLDLGGEDGEREVKDLTDQELVVQDVVLGLVRMDLLDRLHYVLTVLKLKEKVMVTGVLGLVVRLVRHSLAVASLTARHPLVSHLLEFQHSHPLCVKLTRLICAWDSGLASWLLTKLELEGRLSKLLASAGDSLYTTQASVESHRLWAVLLSHGLATSLWSSLHPVIMQRLVLLYNTDQINQPSTVAAWLVLSAGLIMDTEVELVRALGEILENCLTKWLAQLGDKEEVSPTFLQLVSVTCKTLCKYYSSRPDNSQVFADSVLARFFSSRHFKASTARLRSSSPFLTSRPPTSRHPACLPGVGVILEGGHPHPLLTPQSPDILLSGVLTLTSHLATGLNNRLTIDPSSVEMVSSYLTEVSSVSTLSLSSHWLSRHSSVLLHSLLSLYSTAGHLPPPLSLASALTVSTLLQPRDVGLLHSLFTDFIFNSSVLSQLSLSVTVAPLVTPAGTPPSADSVVTAALTQLSSLQSLYSRLLLPETDSNPPPQSGNILPSDWPYFPLISLYNSGQTLGSTLPLSSEDLVSVLAWISLLPARLSPTASLMRLATTLLCPGSVFLVQEISCLLHHNLVSLLSSQQTLDLASEVPGVTSNIDLYQQLVDQFISESYGDRVFSLFLMVACTMDQPLAFRKTLWTEKTDCLKLIQLSEEEVSPLRLSRFTDPPEQDVGVLMSYFRAVVQREVTRQSNPLLHHIAVSQVNNSLSLSDSQQLLSFRNFVLKEFGKSKQIEELFLKC